ncbi:MAG TPA: DNRLRE domain-containing protein, partial [Clostridia bacterium]
MANYDLYLQSSSTDAYYQASNGLQGNTDYAVGKDNSSITYKTAVRFPNVSAGQGISVNSAKLRLYVQFNLGTTGQIRFICTGIKEANTASFSSNPFSRPQTTSNVTLTKGVPNTGTTFDIDVTGIVTEILSQGTWASGNAMGFFVVDNGSDVGAYIEDDSLKAQLLIQLVAPGNFTPT